MGGHNYGPLCSSDCSGKLGFFLDPMKKTVAKKNESERFGPKETQNLWVFFGPQSELVFFL